MKKVLIFSLNYFPFAGGAEVSIREITDRITDIEFHLIAYRFDNDLPRTEKIGNVLVHRVGWGKRGISVRGTFHPVMYLAKILYVPFAALTALRLHRVKRFDLFWAMMSYMTFPIVLMRLVGNRTPYLLSLQDGDPFERVFKRFRIRPFLPLLIYGFRRAAAIQSISTFLLAWARQIGFKGVGAVIPNGTNVGHFSSRISDRERRAVREELGIRDTDTVLVSTSRLVHKNALDDVIRALPLLPESIRFVNFGFGLDGPHLENLARTVRVADRVQLLPHPGLETLPKYLQASDIFIRPSRSEGMGVSFIEAFAAELPVITTQEGGIADFLFDEKRNPDKPTTGWAVNADSPREIAEAVGDILKRPDKVREVIRNAKELALSRYDWNLIAADMRALFDDLLKTR